MKPLGSRKDAPWRWSFIVRVVFQTFGISRGGAEEDADLIPVRAAGYGEPGHGGNDRLDEEAPGARVDVGERPRARGVDARGEATCALPGVLTARRGRRGSRVGRIGGMECSSDRNRYR